MKDGNDSSFEDNRSFEDRQIPSRRTSSEYQTIMVHSWRYVDKEQKKKSKYRVTLYSMHGVRVANLVVTNIEVVKLLIQLI